jgi:hypothetical protein
VPTNIGSTTGMEAINNNKKRRNLDMAELLVITFSHK